MPTGSIERTVQMTLDLPEGQDWAWLPDCNIVVLGSHLDEAGRERAIRELQDQWRRSLIKSAPGKPSVA